MKVCEFIGWAISTANDGLLSDRLKQAVGTHPPKILHEFVSDLGFSSKAEIDELSAAYKKAHKVDLTDEVDKKCKGDVKTLILAKLGRGESYP